MLSLLLKRLKMRSVRKLKQERAHNGHININVVIKPKPLVRQMKARRAIGAAPAAGAGHNRQSKERDPEPAGLMDTSHARGKKMDTIYGSIYD